MMKSASIDTHQAFNLKLLPIRATIERMESEARIYLDEFEQEGLDPELLARLSVCILGLQIAIDGLTKYYGPRGNYTAS